MAKKSSVDSLRALASPRPGALGRSSTGQSTKESRESEAKKASRFALRKGGADDKERSDDLTKMIDRASNYMTFAYIRMPSVVLCLSYKGKEQRNFEDVHDFVFKLPAIEWQNKTWSNLDLALALKKAVVKALISHTGAIIGNKFSRHRPNADQRSRLRELASSSMMIVPPLPGSHHYAGSINESDDSASIYGTSPVDFSRSPPRSLRGSTHSSITAPRANSPSSSIASRDSRRPSATTPSVSTAVQPTFLTMTPPTPVDATNGGGAKGLGLDVFRPVTSGGLGFSRKPTAPSDRPATSHLEAGGSNGNGSGGSSNGRRRGSSGAGGSAEAGNPRRSAAAGFKDKISALTHRMSHREGSSAQDGEAAAAEDNSTEKTPLAKRLSWAPNRQRSGF